MKKAYLSPAMERQLFETSDVITVSPTPIMTFNKVTQNAQDGGAKKFTVGDNFFSDVQ